MIIYYTGPSQPGQPSNPSKSLGGYISESSPLNGIVGNIFPEVTRGAIRANRREVRLLALKNDSNSDLANFKIYTTTPVDSLFEYKMGVILPGYDSGTGRYYFELLSNPHQLPSSPVLDLHEGVGGAISVPSFTHQTYLGLWISREYKPSTVELFNESDGECSTASLANLNTIESIKNSLANIDLTFSWT
jgi:hypothetical protein